MIASIATRRAVFTPGVNVWRTGPLLIGMIAACLVWTPGISRAGVRIKDITDLEGSRGSQLIGFGLVVGLDGTGSKSTSTQQIAVDMLQRFSVTTKIVANSNGDGVFKSGNISAVMVTAEIGPFSRNGSRIDVTVAALDDASSIYGGLLLMTPLRGPDKVDYALAQGPVFVGGYGFSTTGGVGNAPTASAQKNHPTVGRIPSGAEVVREARGNVLCNGRVQLLLREPDFETARSIARAINQRYPDRAIALDAGCVQVFVPSELCSRVVSFVSDIGHLEVNPDTTAKVVINERTGTIVAGNQVRISAVAVTHGNLAVVTNNEPIAAQPLPFARGKTVVLPRGQVGVNEQGGALRVLEPTMTVGDLARVLNALGAAPRDLIIILQAIQKAGALHAEIVKM